MCMSILAAPAAGGKSQACLTWLLERLRPAWQQQHLPEALLVAPGRLQHNQLRERLQHQTSIGITIADFTEACQAIIAANRQPPRLARRPLARQFIAQAMLASADEQTAQGQRPLLAPTGGVLEFVGAAIADLKHGMVGPDAVQAAAGADALTAEVALIYGHYQRRLAQHHLEDRAGLLWAAAETLRDPACRVPWAYIAVDGFDSFLPAQRTCLDRLATHAEVFVTVPWSTAPDRLAHQRFATTLARLRTTCTTATWQIAHTGRLAPAFDQIERTLFVPPVPGGPVAAPRRSPPPLGDAGAPCALWQLETRAAEAREVLREIAWLRTCHGWRANECAIIATDLAEYRPWLEAIAREFGVPLAFTTGETADRLPAISALLLMLDVARDLSGHAALRGWLASPFFSAPFSAAERERLAPAAGMRAGSDDDAALHECVSRHCEPLVTAAEPRPLAAWLAWLDARLRTFNWRPGDADRAWCRIAAALRSMAGPGGMPPLSLDRFADLVRSTAATIVTRHQQPDDAVCVAPLAEARGARWRLVAVIGVAEGLAPGAPPANPLLGATLRQCLRLDDAVAGDHLSQWLHAFSRADQRLIVTRPLRADDGSDCPPAHAWDALVAASGIAPVGCGPLPLASAASLAELHAEAARQGAAPPPAGSRHHARHAAIGIGHAALAARQRASDPLNGDASALAPLLAARYGPQHVWSASRLERYGACPQQFFATSVLALDDPAADPTHRERGQMLHEILSATYQAAMETATPPRQQLAGVAQRVFAAHQAYARQPAAVWHWDAIHATRQLERLIDQLEHEAGEWPVLALEQRFDGLPIACDGATILLRGSIDRVEQRAGGELRVIDFKSGTATVERDPAQNRHQLQLPLYALAAREIFDRPVRDAVYRSIRDGAVSGLVAKGHTLDAALAAAQSHVAQITAGIRAGAFPAEPPADGCPSWCPARAWCWQFTPRRF
ncbi:MAG: PD-(D/E)XK nuclease family protein [Chloroflexi bacterium]|nr:PD-(D/E)XK nuclease family protein [Chloroflexota bacterium]